MEKDDRHFMNPQHGAHMRGEEAQDVKQSSGQHKAPHIHVHTHSGGHTVHVMHHDGRHEMHTDGPVHEAAKHLLTAAGHGGAGQDHGVGDGTAGEEEGALI